MASLPKDKAREQLEQELQNTEYQSLLQRLQQEYPIYRDFSSWNEVLGFMRAGTSDDPLKDEVLRPILAAHAGDNDHHWRTVLLVIFWPGLKSLCIRRRKWHLRRTELWSLAVWAFLEAICTLDLTQRSYRLAQRLINDTTWRLGLEYRKERRQAAFEITTNPEELVPLSGYAEDPGFRELDYRQEQEALIKQFGEYLQTGLINQIDFDLLVGTFVYDKCVSECAEEIGISYQLAKKRRQRAVAAIGRQKKYRGN